MTRLHFSALLTALLLTATSAAARAAEYHVAPTGNDEAAGSASKPWRTLQKAADTVKEGDRVIVADGTYAGFSIGEKAFGPRRVVFQARNRWKARITSPATEYGGEDGIAIVSASYVTIDGFEVTRAPRAGIGVRSLGPDETGVDTRGNIIRNCYSHDNGRWGAEEGAHDGIFTGYALDVLIEYNRVEHNAEHGIYVSNSADNPIIRNNVVKGNYAQGIQINGDGEMDGDGIISNWEISGNVVTENSIAGGSTAINLDGAINGRAFNNLIYANGKGGFVLWKGNGNAPARNNLIYNNTIYQPGGTKAAIVFYTEAADNLVFNNILYSRAGGIEVDEEAGRGNRHDFNLLLSVIADSRADRKLGAHEASPPVAELFADIGAWNLRPRPGGPAIGAGTPTFTDRKAAAADLEGRPRSGAPDIGCYQSTPPVR